MIETVKILEEKKFKAFSMYLREDGIMNTVFEDNILITMEDASRGTELGRKFGG